VASSLLNLFQPGTRLGIGHVALGNFFLTRAPPSNRTEVRFCRLPFSNILQLGSPRITKKCRQSSVS